MLLIGRERTLGQIGKIPGQIGKIPQKEQKIKRDTRVQIRKGPRKPRLKTPRLAALDYSLQKQLQRSFSRRNLSCGAIAAIRVALSQFTVSCQFTVSYIFTDLAHLENHFRMCFTWKHDQSDNSCWESSSDTTVPSSC